ncbi:hypothetical protein SCALM49S_07051 [Streptomyces californicus]
MTTSGSTGAPKDTVVTRAGLRHVFGGLRDAPQLGFPQGLVWAQFHPLTFGYSMCEVLGALAFGGELGLVAREAPLTCAGIRDLVASARSGGRRTALCLTPSELSLLTARLREACVGVPEFVLLSGEPAHRGQRLSSWPCRAASGASSSTRTRPRRPPGRSPPTGSPRPRCLPSWAGTSATPCLASGSPC